jgi:hypothetical protein
MPPSLGASCTPRFAISVASLLDCSTNQLVITAKQENKILYRTENTPLNASILLTVCASKERIRSIRADQANGRSTNHSASAASRRRESLKAECADHRPWKSILPISTFPRHDHDEDEYLLKPAGLRDTHSEGKVKQIDVNATNRM